jgi:hypothetical protein
MKVRPKAAPSPRAQYATETAKPVEPAMPFSVPAPVRGLVTAENLALMQPGAALVLDNWFPTATGMRLRKGTSLHATVHASNPVVSMFTYTPASGAAEMFAATASAIYDVTAPASTTVIPTAEVSGKTSGYWSTAQFATAGGNFLYAVNGDDSALLYDGVTWQVVTAISTPIAVTGVTTASLSHVWSFANRLWFVEQASLRAWYLPVDSIGGAAVSFSLAGVFRDGGSLLFGASWSLDAGDGLDDKCIFVSDQGEVAVYEGGNPSSATDWAKVGVYRISKPLGPKAIMQAGGDLLVATQSGIVPLTEAVRKDVGALSIASVSRSIEPDWREAYLARSGMTWEILKWPAKAMMLVSCPRTNTGQEAFMLVANLETGAWCRFTGLDSRCLGTVNNRAFYGSADGKVYEMESGGDDAGASYTASFVGLFDSMGAPEFRKTAHMARATFRYSTSFLFRLSASVDYRVELPSAPNAAADDLGAVWGTSLWGSATWGGTGSPEIKDYWSSIGRSGYAIAPQIQVTSGSSTEPEVEFVSLVVTFEKNALVA